jgi:hypothetical protein
MNNVLPYAITKKYTDDQRRVLLIGPPKFGKTWSSLTAPNPIVADFDRGLAGYPNEVITLPFWDKTWVSQTFKVVHQTEGFMKFLLGDATLLDQNSTLVIDSLSTLSDALTVELDAKCPQTRSGEKDSFWFWKQWSNWLCTFCNQLTRLKCHVILICHEQEIRDSETGKLIGYRFLLKGQDFPPRMPQFFTDIIRAIRKTEIVNGKAITKFIWQIKPDNLNPILYTRLQTDEVYIPANWNELVK